MSRDEYIALVEQDLRLRHVPFSRRDLVEFMHGVWPLVEPEDLPAVWAEAFLQATAHRQPA